MALRKREKGRSAASKRTSLPRRADYTSQFLKDWEKLSLAGRHDMKALKAVMAKIVENEVLPAELGDHALEGEWADHRDCHVRGDFLLIYKLTGLRKNEQVVFVRTGTHADLFKDES